MRLFLLVPMLTAAFGASPSTASPLTAIKLAPHRVVYDLTLASSSGSRGVESARGRIAFDFTGDACEGYATTYRQVTVLESGEVGARTSDLRTTAFEAADGSSFRFKTETETQGVPKKLDGDAERKSDGVLAVRLAQPKRERLTFNGDPVFPSDHMKRLIAAAHAGETTLALKVFDGGEDGRQVYDTLAVIGRKIESGQEARVEAPLKIDALRTIARWPVTLSYFKQGQGERTPIYTLAFDLYENGVSGALRLDYGEFALKGEVSRFELMPEKGCQR